MLHAKVLLASQIPMVCTLLEINFFQGGTVFTSYLKLLPLWLMIFPGMMSRVLYPNEVACAVPEECKRICQSE